MFDSEENMVRLDMSEYMEKHAVSRLIGAPPGYIGYDEGGQLTEAVRRKPYCVILFDEIEKAHVDVFNTLLQILDDGRLTDSQGRMVDFKNTIIIMTSNIGSRHLIEEGSTDKSGDIGEKTRDAVMAEMRAHFRPEFLNRVDEIVLFKPLTLREIERIVDLQLNLLRSRLAERHIELHLTDEAKELLARRGYDPIYGARPLKRVIQRELETKLSRSLLKGEIADNSRVEVVAHKGELEFKSKPAG
jgi:ATP-dependent Clp protease ATP-binding subunit ClpB